MKIVGKETYFTSQVERFITTGKNENEGSYKPSTEQVNHSINDFFDNQKDTVTAILTDLSNASKPN